MAEKAPELDPRARRRRRIRNGLIASAAVLVAYTLIGFFVVPWVITGWIVPRIGRAVNGSLTIARASTNPFTFECVLEGLELKDDRGVRTASLDRFEGNLETWPTIFSRGYTFERAVVVNPYIRAEVLESRRFNFETILKLGPVDPKAKPARPLQRIPRIRIERLVVTNGEIFLRDSSLRKPFEASWGGLNMDVTPLDLDPAFKSPTKLVAETANGERLEISAQMVADPPELDGEIKLSGLQIAAFMPYLQEYAQGEVSGGTLSADLAFQFGPAQSPPLVRAQLREATIKDLEIKDKQGSDGGQLVRVPLVKVTDAKADATARTLTVALTELADATTVIERLADGSFALQRAVLPAQEPGEPPPELRLPYPVEAVRDGIREFVDSNPRVDPATINLPLQRLFAAIRNIIEDMGQAWDISLEQIRVVNGTTTWIDHATPSGEVARIGAVLRHATLGPIRTVEEFQTPINAELAIGESGVAKIETTIRPLVRSLSARVKLTDLDLAPLGPYTIQSGIEGVGALGAGAGQLSADGAATAALSETNDFALTWDGVAGLAGLSLRSESGTTPLKWSNFTLNGTPSATIAASGDVTGAWKGDLAVRGVVLDLPELATGTIEEATIKGDASVQLTGSASSDGTRTSGAFSGDLMVRTLDGAAASFGVDRANLGEVLLSGRVEAASVVGGERSLAWDGTTRVQNLAAQGPLARQALGETAGPVDAKIASLTHTGTMRVVGTAASPDAASAPAAIELAGDAAIDGVTAAMERVAPPTVEAASLTLGPTSVTGMDIRLATSQIGAAKLSIQNPRLEISSRLVPPTAEDSPRDASRDVGAGLVLPFDLRLGGVAIAGGSARISDASGLPGATEIMVDEIEATLSAINSADPAASPVAVHAAANVDGTGTFVMDGTLSLFTPAIGADLTTTIRTLPLKPFDPYAGRFVGYTIDRGRMNITLPIKVTERKLDGTLDFAFDGLFLGDSVESPDAPDLPLKLGLALLRDSNDRVASKIPFSGDLSDPQFSLGGVIWQAFLSLIGKAVTAPFQLLASVFSEGEDLSHVAFEPGTDSLAEGSLSRLDALGRALTERPALRMSIITLETPELDRAALQGIMLREELLAFHKANDPAGGTITSLTLEQLAMEVRRAYLLMLQVSGQPRPTEQELPPLEAMEAALMKAIVVPPERFESLRVARTQRVAAVLTTESKIDAARLKTDAAAAGSDAVADADSPRSVFELDSE
jgi:hypothetical protein